MISNKFEIEMNRIDFAFLDSGIGGIPYMISLKEKQKNASCVYIGDTKNFPYGEKTPDEVIKCVKVVVKSIIEKWNPKTLVIACNTISVTALDSLRKTFPNLPIVGTVPAIKLAAKVTENKRIGFLATNATVNNQYSTKLIEDFASDCVVVKRGDPNLVSFIEHDFFTSTEKQKENAVKPAVDFFAKNECDTVILACTHFTHIANTFQKVAGKNINVIDSREGVSNQAIKVENEIQDSNNNEDFLENDCSFFVTKATEEQKIEYKKLCENYNIPWGGIISL